MNETRNGILLIDKPMDMTSFDVIAILRKTLWTRQLGHTGTLDPNATGLLTVLVNKATKLVPYLSHEHKTYECTMKLGYKSDTGDIWGKTIQEEQIPVFDETTLRNVLNSFLGESEQIPPMVSAIKVNGKKLYEYARENIEIERKPRNITIYSIQLRSYTSDSITFVTECSGGTYIRTLCEDIAKKLNTVAVMSALRRTQTGMFSIERAKSLQQVKDGDYELIPIRAALSHYPYIEYEEVKDIYNGRSVSLTCSEEQVLLGHNEEALAIYQKDETGMYHCLRGLW